MQRVPRFCASIRARPIILHCSLLTLLASASALFGQGSLTPPGAPALTFKTLQQLEPRVDLQNAPASAVDTTNAGYHFIINQAGSYYLSANLGVTKTNGILINIDGVVLDLNGFQISRSSGSGGNGIEIVTAAHRTSVHNGSVKGFSSGVTGTARNMCLRGIRVTACTAFGIDAIGNGAVIESCQAHDNSGTAAISAGGGSSFDHCIASNNTVGFAIDTDDGSSLANCAASNNSAIGILTGASTSLMNCTASNNGTTGINSDSGSSLTNCSASGNHTGISAGSGSSLNNCSALGNTLGGIAVGENSTLNNCAASLNQGNGIFSLNTAGGVILNNCVAVTNSGDGIKATTGNTITNCTSHENGGDGIEATSNTTIRGCTVTNNDGNGILVTDSCLISDCVANVNGRRTGSPVNTASDGIEMGARNRVVNCTVFNNAQHGINSTSSSNRNFIDGCMLQLNTGFGINLAGNGNTVIRNQVGGNTGGTINQTGFNIAPIQNASDPATTPMHPLANFP